MQFIMMNSIRKSLIVASLSALAALAACGGGGGDAGTPPFGSGSGTDGSGNATATVQVAMTLSSQTVTAAAPATVTAVVTSKSSTSSAAVPVVGTVVSFSTTNSLGSFNTSSALTNADGVATVALYPAANATSGADTVIASASVNGVSASASQGFQLTATNVTITSFTSDVPTLSAYGQATLTAVIGGAATGTPVSVSINSTCVGKNKATLTPATATSTNGTVTFTYKDQGCGATDTNDPLKATIVGGTATSSLNLALSSPAANAITFTSASPETIYLKGSGFTETSQVTFQVRDLAGNALPNQSVTMEATTLTGGLTLDGGVTPVTKTSDSSGNVTVRVNSGTVPTPMRVRATLGGSGISTVSSSLSIAVGLPSQLNFSLSQDTINIEGYNIDGIENTYSIIASDRLGNPVPVGTSINFVTEGGQIEASKQTALVNGLARATVNFVTSSPKPQDGRVTVLAYALGEESFIDLNGNNVFDAGEAFQDLGDVYIDRAFDGTYQPAEDQFISLSISGSTACTTPTPAEDPLSLLGLNASIPSRPGTCKAGWGQAYVRRAAETVFSTSSARPLWANASGRIGAGCGTVNLKVDAAGNTDTFALVGPGGITRASADGSLSLLAADANPVRLNPMAAGTVISATATTGLSVTVTGGTPVANTASVTGVSMTYSFTNKTTPTSGIITVNFRSPGGLITSVPVSISTDPAGAVGSCAF